MIRINNNLYSITTKNSDRTNDINYTILQNTLLLETITSSKKINECIHFVNAEVNTEEIYTVLDESTIKYIKYVSSLVPVFAFLDSNSTRYVTFIDSQDKFGLYSNFSSISEYDCVHFKNYILNLYGIVTPITNIIINTININEKRILEKRIIDILSKFFYIELIATYPTLYDKNHFNILFHNKNNIKPIRYAFTYDYSDEQNLSPQNIINGKQPVFVYLNYLYLCDSLIHTVYLKRTDKSLSTYYKRMAGWTYFSPANSSELYELLRKKYFERCIDNYSGPSSPQICLADSCIFYNLFPEEITLIRYIKYYTGGA